MSSIESEYADAHVVATPYAVVVWPCGSLSKGPVKAHDELG
jgi:hypothetical protein